MGLDEMPSRKMLEDVIERPTKQLKQANATLRSINDEFRQAQENLKTLEKEHKRVVHQRKLRTCDQMRI